MGKKWLVLGLLVSVTALARAEDYELIGPEGNDTDMNEMLNDAPSHNYENARWEVSLGFGRARPQGTNDLSTTANHDALTLDEFEEEFEERGLTSPGPGFDVVKGSMKSSYEINLNALRRFGSYFSLGAEWGIKLSQDLDIVESGAYNQPFFDVTYRSTIYHAFPIAKLGIWLGPVRPYVLGGIGWYDVSQNLTLTLKDDDDAPDSVTVDDHSNSYIGSCIGGGLGVKITNGFTLNVEVRSERIYAPHGGYKFFTPGGSLTYYF